MITVYKFKIYDIGNDEWQKSCRMGTLDGINLVRGVRLEETAIPIDDADVGDDGLTERNFSPQSSGQGFPRTIGS